MKKTDFRALELQSRRSLRLEYTLVHNSFKQLVEDLLAAHLAELEISMEEFTSFCEYGLSAPSLRST